MAQEKPMTVKERMEALARASGQSSAASAPVPRASSAATGPSVAERLAKMRAGPADAPTGEAPRLVRTLTPHPGAPTVVTSMPGGTRASSKRSDSSSVADRVASLSGSGSGKSSILPPSPSGRPAGSSASPAAVKTSQGEGEVSAPAEPPASSKLSPGLAARMKAMRSSTDSVPEGEEGEEEEETPPPPPALATSGSSSSSSKVSPGLAARMGRAFPIPMPGGGMPAGGVAELKRRKQEKEQAERAAAGMPEEPKPSETAVEQKPGELQHANLSRPTISQRRRPRKATRPFKPTAAAAAAVPAAAAAAAAAAPASPPYATEPENATSNVPEKTASPPPATTGASSENTAEKTAAPAAAVAAAAAAVTPAQMDTNSVGKMSSMLKAASIHVANDDEDDDEWDE